MVEAIAGIAGTTKTSFTIGDGKDGYVYIYANNNLGIIGGIRYNNTDQIWEFTNTGINWLGIGTGPTSLGEDGYIVAMVNGVPSWIAANQTVLNTLIIGNNTSDTASIEFKTLSADATLTFDGYTLSVNANDSSQNIVLYANNDASTVIIGNETEELSIIKLANNTGDGYITYDGYDIIYANNDTETILNETPRWIEIPVADYNSNTPSAQTVYLNKTKYMDKIFPGDVIKWLSSDRIGLYDDDAGQISDASFIGIDKSNVSSNGVIYLVCTQGSLETNFTWYLYKNSSLRPEYLVAHTAEFSDLVSAPQTLIEDNNSGITGTITNTGTSCEETTISFLFEWVAIVDDIENTTYSNYPKITIRGVPFVAETGNIIALWYGKSELMTNVRLHVSGNISTGGITDSLLANNSIAPYNHRWGLAQIVEFGGVVADAGSSPAQINLINGSSHYISTSDITLSTSWAWSLADIDPQECLLTRINSTIDIALKVAGTDVTDLDVELTYVRL